MKRNWLAGALEGFSKKTPHHCLFGVAAFVVGASPVSAIQFTSVPGQQFSQEPNVTTINFDLGLPNDCLSGIPTTGIAVYSGNIETLGPDSPRGIANDNTCYLVIAGNGRRVTINFATSLNYFALYWGSLDPSNTIEFYNNETLIDSFVGLQITSVPASWTNPSSNLYVNFFAEGDESFNTVVLKSPVAFESDNHAYRVANSESVPEPTTTVSLLAFGSLGVSSLLKRKQKQ